MKEKLYELQGFIEQSIKYEKEWYARNRLYKKLEAINNLLSPMPYGISDIIEQFEREIK